MTDVFLVSGVRTAIGAFGGALKDTPPSELGVATAKEAIVRAGVPVDAIGHAVYGQVLPSEPRDAYMARIVAIEAGLPVETPALTVNRLCGSGLQAIVSAAQALLLGDCEVALAGGAESMSRTPFYLSTHRWGRKLGDAVLVDGEFRGRIDAKADRAAGELQVKKVFAEKGTRVGELRERLRAPLADFARFNRCGRVRFV